MEKQDVLDNDKINRNGFWWNMISGTVNAFQSVIILIFLSRVTTTYYAGIFTIAYSVSNLLLNIGHFNVRNFQVTDSKKKYSFSDYFHTRLFTFFFMIIASIFYVGMGGVFWGYSSEKIQIVFLICIFKGMDCLEDVFWGNYQQAGRLDIGSRYMAIRLILETICFCCALIFFHSLLKSTLIATVFGLILMAGFVLHSMFIMNIRIEKINRNRVFMLIRECFPLFLSAFFSFYILNAPKYAIDIFEQQELQAYYGYISMPVFVISLFNNFLYQPILASLAQDWNNNRISSLVQKIKKQILQVSILSILTLLFGMLVGIKILSFMYNTNLGDYQLDFFLLLLAGGIYAYIGFITIVLTIMRHQKSIAVTYMLVAVVTFIGANVLVKNFAIRGAAIQYVLSMITESAILTILMLRNIKKATEDTTYAGC